MSDTVPGLNPTATDHLPWFVTAPGQTDTLLNVMAIFLVLIIFMVGLLYLRLHSLPEHMAHRTNKVQLQFVAVLALLALFTHNHAFWIAALLLALIELPDLGTPIASIARSLERLSGRDQSAPTAEAPPPIRADEPPEAQGSGHA